MIRSHERTLFIALAMLVWCIVIWQALTQPFVHDEARVYYNFVQVSKLLPFHTSWDAGNHLLSSCGAWVTTRLFGISHLSLRLFSVLCFVPYAWYGWRWGSFLPSFLVRWPFLLCWTCTPFLLEFFSLFRGYGPGLAFLAMGSFHTVKWAQGHNQRDLVLALVGMSLAVWSNLALVVVHGVVLGYLFVLHWPLRRSTPWHNWITLLLVGILPWVYAVLYGRGLAAHGALYYGTTAGLVNGTLASLLQFMLGFHGPFLQGVFTALFFALVAWALVSLWRKGISSPLVFMTAALVLELPCALPSFSPCCYALSDRSYGDAFRLDVHPGLRARSIGDASGTPGEWHLGRAFLVDLSLVCIQDLCPRFHKGLGGSASGAGSRPGTCRSYLGKWTPLHHGGSRVHAARGTIGSGRPWD